MLIEEWTSPEALYSHIRSDDFRKILAAMDLAATTPDLSFLTVSSARGFDLVAELRQKGRTRTRTYVTVLEADARDKSNSGGMYLALAAYLANGNNVVDNEADADKVAASMVGLFSKQGFQESSSAGPFEDYTSMGIGKAPLVMIYEQQFLEYVLSHPNPNPDMVLLYPGPPS